MKKIILILLVIPIISSLIACTRNNSNEVENIVENSTPETITITDSAGVEVEVPTNVDEIICVWPSGTQLLVTLGLGDLLIGVSGDSKEQSWAVEMYPRLAEIPALSNEESAESIMNLNADIVLTTESDVAEYWRSKGITAVTFSYYSVDEMYNTISTLSQIVPDKYSKKCMEYLDYLKSNISNVSTALEGKVIEKESVYYIHGNNNKGLYKTAGGNTMNEEWATAAYTNFATSTLLDSSETVVDAEAILGENPDVIVIGGRYQHQLYNELMSTDEWSNINAVVDGKVYTIPYGISPFDRFGAEFALMIPWLANTVYPQLFSYNIEASIKEFYSTFTGYNLSDEQVSYIINGLGPNGMEDTPNE